MHTASCLGNSSAAREPVRPSAYPAAGTSSRTGSLTPILEDHGVETAGIQLPVQEHPFAPPALHGAAGLLPDRNVSASPPPSRFGHAHASSNMKAAKVSPHCLPLIVKEIGCTDQSDDAALTEPSAQHR